MSSLAAVGSAASPWVYAGFIGIVLLLLAIDLGVFNRKAHAPSMREAVGWSAVWISLALLFSGAVYFLYENHTLGLGRAVPVVGSAGETTTLDGAGAVKVYLTAYLVEKSLSIDNVFVIAMIFSSLAIPVAFQHRVLYWGILGALVMRGLMIGVGSKVIAEFSWIVYVFGGLLVVSALRMAFSREDAHDPRRGRLVRLMGRIVPLSPDLDGQRLLSPIGGVWHATPLLVALVVIEATDLMFAVDSIPAVFAITGDPFIVFTSNIMAILGLRSLYFCLASAMMQFRYLKSALVAVLLFVGIKMCLVHTAWKIPAEISLAVILGLLISGITASLLARVGANETPIEEGLVPDVRPRPASAVDAWRLAIALWRSNRTLRRVAVLTVGSLIVVTGLVISPLPGPGLTILGPLGIGILASEFLWARRFARHAVVRERSLRSRLDAVLIRFPRLLIIPAVALLWFAAVALSRYTDLPSWAMWSLTVPILTPMLYVLYRWHKVRAGRRRAAAIERGDSRRIGAAEPTGSSIVTAFPSGPRANEAAVQPSPPFKEKFVKRFIGKFLFVVGSPVIAFGLLSAGAAGKEHLGGRLVQVTGGFLALIWLTGTFLLVGTVMTRAMGYRAPDRAPTASCIESSASRERKKQEDAEA